MSVVDPLSKVEAGLKGTGDKPIPLQSVHIRAKLLDLAAQVGQFVARQFLNRFCKYTLLLKMHRVSTFAPPSRLKLLLEPTVLKCLCKICFQIFSAGDSFPTVQQQQLNTHRS